MAAIALLAIIDWMLGKPEATIYGSRSLRRHDDYSFLLFAGFPFGRRFLPIIYFITGKPKHEIHSLS
jgi:hypothetical protein